MSTCMEKETMPGVEQRRNITIEVDSAINLEKDIPAIQDVFYQTWLATYPNEKEGITKEDIEAMFADRHSPEKHEARRREITRPPQGQHFLIAKEGGVVVGVCRVIKREKENVLSALYVLPEYQHRGIGERLWTEAQQHLSRENPTRVVLAAYNEQTRRFYEKLGFRDTLKRSRSERFVMKSGIAMPEMEMIKDPEQPTTPN